MQRVEEAALNMPSDPEGPEPIRGACSRADTERRRLYLSERCQFRCPTALRLLEDSLMSYRLAAA
jgi:hypothetical protein